MQSTSAEITQESIDAILKEMKKQGMTMKDFVKGAKKILKK